MFLFNKWMILFVQINRNRSDHRRVLKIFVWIHRRIPLVFKHKSLLQIQSISVSYYSRHSSVSWKYFRKQKKTQKDFHLDSQVQQQTKISGNIRSSSSSHSSFTSDEQSIFFPLSTHHYSTSQMSNSTTTNSINTNAKPFIPASLSNPSSAKIIDQQDVHLTPNSFFANGHQSIFDNKNQTSFHF